MSDLFAIMSIVSGPQRAPCFVCWSYKGKHAARSRVKGREGQDDGKKKGKTLAELKGQRESAPAPSPKQSKAERERDSDFGSSRPAAFPLGGAPKDDPWEWQRVASAAPLGGRSFGRRLT